MSKNLNQMQYKAMITLLIVCTITSLLSAIIVTPVQAQANTATARKPSQDLVDVPYTTTTSIKVIVQIQGTESSAFTSFLTRKDVLVTWRYPYLSMYAMKVNSTALADLLKFNEVYFVSQNKRLKRYGHVTETTGAVAARTMNSGGPYDGKGIGVAVLDSGIDTTHKAFLNNGLNSVVYSKDFSGEGKVTDPYGHGTLVASEIVGSASIANRCSGKVCELLAYSLNHEELSSKTQSV